MAEPEAKAGDEKSLYCGENGITQNLDDTSQSHYGCETGGTITSSWEESEANLFYPSDVALKTREAVTAKKSMAILPERVSVTESFGGAEKFVLVSHEALPHDLNSAFAHFEDIAVIELKKENDHNLIGIVPARSKPGTVTVTVMSPTKDYLGETLFEYWDSTQELLDQLIGDTELQRLFWELWKMEYGTWNVTTPEYAVSESGYDGGDEASSSHSSGDGN